MTESVIKSVHTQGVSFAPILKYFFEKSGIAEIIDDNVFLDPRRKVLSHGQASISMITAIMFQVMQLYKICRFAKETTILDVILPGIHAEEYFDDRLADTLDAIYHHGIGNIEMLITQKMISEFNIENTICHNDTTSASVYGNYDNSKNNESINITFGHSKKHRQDLKQLVWSLSVSSDGAFPLFQKAYSGNTSDVNTYVEQWHNLIDLLGHEDFLYVADSKLATKENMAHIQNNDGYFIAPAPMYETYKTVFLNALEEHEYEVLLPYKNQINRGFEVPLTIEHDEKNYSFRMIILFDHGLLQRKHKTLYDRIEKTENAFHELKGKLNQYRLKTEESIDKACKSILAKYHTADFFSYRINNHPVITYKNKIRGRVAKNKEPELIAISTDCFSADIEFHKDIFKQSLYQCGYYPLITNKTKEDLSIEDAMMAHKNQYKVEHINRRAKGPYKLEPIYIHTPERIESFLFLFKLALQIIVLVERTARKNINERDKGLDDFMPNRQDVRNPRTESLLKEFEYVVRGSLTLPDGNLYNFVSELTDLQKDILVILGVPPECFSYQYLFDSS